jgi:Cu+-exporting ATPase
VFRKGEAIETLSRIDLLAIDKTGTLTEGTFSDIRWTPSSSFRTGSENALREDVLAAVQQSSHPVSQAIATSLSTQGVSPHGHPSVEEYPGKGLIARWTGKEGGTLHIGNLSFLRDSGIDGSGSFTDPSLSGVLVGVARNGILAGTFSLSDKLRPEADHVLRYFSSQGVEVHLLTGDGENEALRIARLAGISPDRVHAALAPEEKRNRVRQWEDEGRTVAMAGDGINDAGALAQASVGIAVANATALTRENGDILLLGNHLLRLVDAHRAANRTMAKIRQNLGWAFLYNVLGIPLAGGALYPFFHIFVPPYYSGLAMSLSSVTVVANALSLTFSIRETPLPPDSSEKTLPEKQPSPGKA